MSDDVQATEVVRRTTCGAGMDGECYADGCVQQLDGEPTATGRFCPLPIGNPLMALRESDEDYPPASRVEDDAACDGSCGEREPHGLHHEPLA